MLRRISILLGVICCANAQASPAPLPSPTPVSTPALIDSLAPADLRQVLPLLRKTFINPAALSDTDVDRATLQGLMLRLGQGVALFPNRAAAQLQEGSPLYNEVLAGHIGYLRLGSLTPSNLKAMDAALKEFSEKKVDALVIDLRASPPTNDFATAAEFAKRFCPKGKILFTLRKPAAKEEHVFSSDRDPSYQGMLMVLTDKSTAGPAEALAGLLRLYDKAMIIGEPTAGRAVEYSDLSLPSGKILRVAVSEAVLPQTQPLYPSGVKPDLLVEMPEAEKQAIFQESQSKGMSRYVFETARPHFNEAALLAGQNPEIDEAEAAQQGRAPARETLHDRVLQRAVDVVTSLGIYEKR
jgi:Peptidase family S41